MTRTRVPGETTITRRQFTLIAPAALLCGVVGREARADTYASGPIMLLVPFTPGGSVDLLARLVSPKMSERLGQPVVVLNVPGASGAIATQRLVGSGPTGYTLEIGTPREIITAKLVNPNVTYDAERDFTYIALGAKSPIVVAGGPSLKDVKTLTDLIAEARKRPGQLTYATSGVGSPQHFLGELIKQRYGVDLVHVPFTGGAGGLVDVLGGHVDITIITLSSALEYIRAGKLQAYGIGDETRTPLAPGLPALAENKELAGVDISIWYGLLGPAKMPEPIVARLNDYFHAALKQPEAQDRLNQHATSVITEGTPADFEAYASRDLTRYRETLKTTKMQVR